MGLMVLEESWIWDGFRRELNLGWYQKGVEFGMVSEGSWIWDGFSRELNLGWFQQGVEFGMVSVGSWIKAPLEKGLVGFFSDFSLADDFIILLSHWLMISSSCSLNGSSSCSLIGWWLHHPALSLADDCIILLSHWLIS